ncbi:relaxase/mobilization nuclease domain-containing protein (plasmid) [Peteryoungia desertarenae]|uniref:Relaxase/mobilization nuclease domain-containing protein n=1 Tax=Peteryoungia desertarenae TaxID=1813451 RepID=A0ABX6QTB3_9HYPH|nr:relaxase/mobilization nuclease domain-containing protein [Peteryoungia desertarenae]
MILVGSQRGGAGNLARHLMNAVENEHVTVHELRGFVADKLPGALAEAHAISKVTQCQQFIFSLSLNPPKGQDATVGNMMQAAEQAEQKLGLSGQPRAVVVHEKKGRRHIHVVWSRIDADSMKAINLPFFKQRLAALSKELYLEHGWELLDGHKENGWKNPLNFTMAEWQQAGRIGLDPREVKQIFRTEWKQSDSMPAFRAALEERGYVPKGQHTMVAAAIRQAFIQPDHDGAVQTWGHVAD